MVELVKISEISLSTMMVLSLKVTKGVLVCGCINASVSSNAARVAVSADDKLGMLNCLGGGVYCVTHPCFCCLCYVYFLAPAMV